MCPTSSGAMVVHETARILAHMICSLFFSVFQSSNLLTDPIVIVAGCDDALQVTVSDNCPADKYFI